MQDYVKGARANIVQEFAKTLSGTQAMTQFILERVERDNQDFEVLFFDEMIKRKLNRMSLSKLGVSWLCFCRQSSV
jgi:hypothetical protein